jgi:uncharacterized damage-inducible protein DinB
MKLDEIYPYWPETHDEFVDWLRYIDDNTWNSAPLGPAFGSIRLLVVRFIQLERQWMIGVVQNREVDPLIASDLVARADVLSQFEATRAATSVYFAPLAYEALRSVRTAPADPEINEIERNVPLSWILWLIVQNELMMHGQVRALAKQLRNR